MRQQREGLNYILVDTESRGDEGKETANQTTRARANMAATRLWQMPGTEYVTFYPHHKTAQLELK